jgi:hypothetical protein
MINSATFVSAVISPLTMRDFESDSVDSILHSSSCPRLMFQDGLAVHGGYRKQSYNSGAPIDA